MFFKTTLQTLSIGSLILVGTVLGTSCSTTPPASMMDIQTNSLFELKQPITIPAGKAKTFIQFGKISGQSFDRREQHCRLEINELQQHKTTIQPEKFRIHKIQIGEEQIATQRLPAGIKFAFVSNASAQADNQPPETMDYVHFYLESKTQPNVLRLTCAGALSNGNPMDAPSSYRPQRTEINQILGQIGTI